MKRIKSTEIGLWVVPLSPVAFEKVVRFLRAPSSGRIFGNGRTFRGAPHIKDRINERPCCFHAVRSVEKRRIATYAIVYQRGVRATGGFAETFAVAEIHRNVSDAHFCSRTFRAKRNGNSFVRLNVEDKPVRFYLLAAHV